MSNDDSETNNRTTFTDPDLALNAESLAALRQQTLRTYLVERAHDTPLTIHAHYHDGGQNAAGHLSFFGLDPDGGQQVIDTFSVHDWRRVTDITPAIVDGNSQE